MRTARLQKTGGVPQAWYGAGLLSLWSKGRVGSNPTPRAFNHTAAKMKEFAIWLLSVKGNRESTIKRKMKYFKKLYGTPQEMISQVLKGSWADKVKSNALDAIYQYAEFIGVPVKKVKFRVFDNLEVYIPTPDMVKAFLYRVTKTVRARILVAVETGASAGECWRLEWKDFNVENKRLTVVGIKGHKTLTYPVSNELYHLLIQMPRKGDRIFFTVFNPEHMNARINYYAKLLAKETGNSDYKKIHFHTFRHYAISWYYFKSKDPFKTQRFARHHSIFNTQKYVHFVDEFWIKANEYDVVYAENKDELTKYLSEGYTMVTKTDWGYCLTKPKMTV